MNLMANRSFHVTSKPSLTRPVMDWTLASSGPMKEAAARRVLNSSGSIPVRPTLKQSHVCQLIHRPNEKQSKN